MKLKTMLAALLATSLLPARGFVPNQRGCGGSNRCGGSTRGSRRHQCARCGSPDQRGRGGRYQCGRNRPTGGGTDTNAAPAASAAAAAPAAPTIPLIQFQDVPLTTAIEALARQANINYLLDPKIGFGQPDANGQVKAEPNLSIRWENIPAQHALEALLSNYGLQLVEDTKTKIYRISTKDPAALPTLETRVIQLKYASTTNMMDSIQGALTDKRSRVIPDTRTSQLIVVATDPEQAAVDTLVDQLDTPTKQVLIETRLVEISSNPTSKKGIDWSGTLAAQNMSFGNNSTTPQSYAVNHNCWMSGGTTVNTPRLNGSVGGILGCSRMCLVPPKGIFSTRPGFLNADGAHAVLSFLNASADAQVMSTPRVVTLDNETATISVSAHISHLADHRRHPGFARWLIHYLLQRGHRAAGHAADFRQQHHPVEGHTDRCELLWLRRT